MAAKFEIRSSKPGEFNWVLTSQGRILAMGESYTRKASAEKAIDSLRKAAGTAVVADLTLAPAKAASAKTAPAKAARATGRAVGKAVVKVEKVAAKAATKVTKAAKPAKAAKAAKPAKAAKSPAKKAAAPRKRAPKAG
jgi:uncharacterized protein YegP (UPF0339 family)